LNDTSSGVLLLIAAAQFYSVNNNTDNNNINNNDMISPKIIITAMKITVMIINRPEIFFLLNFVMNCIAVYYSKVI
jgi:hypothetical protein